MDFARKQLQKYGWAEGKGLGKHENGISEALKPKLKHSVTGIGHDAATDFTEHWWSALYDKAASNVQVKEKNGTTKKISTKDSDEFEITSSMWKIKRKKKNVKNEQYADYFVKKAVLSNGGSKTAKIGESDSEEEVEKKDVFKMTDEELFIACGGRTAHKGARHGLKALGKLARIERQENMLLNEPRFEGYSHKKVNKKENKLDCVVEDVNSDEEVDVKEKHKKKKKYCSNITDAQIDIVTSSLRESLTNKKKQKKAHKNIAEDMDLVQENVSENAIENICADLPKMKTKKKKRKENLAKLTESEINESEMEQSVKIFKKRKLKGL